MAFCSHISMISGLKGSLFKCEFHVLYEVACKLHHNLLYEILVNIETKEPMLYCGVSYILKYQLVGMHLNAIPAIEGAYAYIQYPALQCGVSHYRATYAHEYYDSFFWTILGDPICSRSFCWYDSPSVTRLFLDNHYTLFF